MNKALQSFGLSLFIVLSFVVIGVGFLFGIDNPVPWVMIAVLIALPWIHKRVTARQFVTWREDLAIGIGAVDEDHRKLFGLINNLQTAIYYPAGETFERQALNELVDYTKYHFTREEELMERNGYPELAAHKRQHQEMIAKVQSYLDAYESDREGTVQALTLFLKDWLIHHIAGTDRQYGPFLRDKGLV
jgi:hemerythrin-like metal-binding protein